MTQEFVLCSGSSKQLQTLVGKLVELTNIKLGLAVDETAIDLSIEKFNSSMLRKIYPGEMFLVLDVELALSFGYQFVILHPLHGKMLLDIHTNDEIKLVSTSDPPL